MTALDIATIGEPVLRASARTIPIEDIQSPPMQRFIDDLIETMRAANGAGLAANQVFRSIRLCAVEVRPNNPRYPYKPAFPLTILVNPRVTALTDETFDNYEGCLSVPGLRGVVPRAVGVHVEALDRHGKPTEREVWGLSAGTFQHECDHLDGRLFIDRVRDTTTLCTWEMFSRYHESDFVTRAKGLIQRFGA